jgi:hypothetical protein
LAASLKKTRVMGLVELRLYSSKYSSISVTIFGKSDTCALRFFDGDG